MECPSTRDLYLGFLGAKNSGKKTISQIEGVVGKENKKNLMDLKKEMKAKKRGRILKVAAIVLAIIVGLTVGFKLR